ncbi:MAG: FHA domain-containing protein [Kofleriaceae bacterium]
MEVPRISCVLVVDGVSRRVGANGALIGRLQDCDVVANDPELSRRHALVRLDGGGAELIPLGKKPVVINGRAHGQPTSLHDGDVLELPGLRLVVRLSAQKPDAGAKARFHLELASGEGFGVSHSPFVLGGDSTDDVIVKKWPRRALRFHIAQDELFLEVLRGRALHNGVGVAPGILKIITNGDVVEYRGERFTIHQRTLQGAATTTVGTMLELPSRVTIELLPRGGRVIVATRSGDHAVFLHERRLDLVVALLRPPAAYRAGEFIPDEVVTSTVWPRNLNASRTELNVLISRCRKSLVEAGLAGPRLIQRSPTGGATRFALAATADIVVKS